MTTNDRSLLEERLNALGLARTTSLSPSSTITPETLALLRAGRANDETIDAPVGGPAHEELPRMALDAEVPVGIAPSSPDADFKIVSVLGEGGMGRVLLARQRSLAREIALKTIKPGAAAAASDALLREGRITGALEHPGVVPIYALAFDDVSRPMLVMKRVDGVDLETLLQDHGHPAWKARGRSPDHLVAALEILVQLCLTLEFAHSRRIVHRDIKPKNIMVGSFGEVYLVDWGIATSTRESVGDLLGTPLYMAPEMALGQPVDERTDVYLIGATLHEILMGTPRHTGATIDDVLRSAIRSEPFTYPSTVANELASLCNRAMSQEPDARPTSVEAIRLELSAFIRASGARALNDAALVRLTALASLLDSPGVPTDLARAYRLVTEARFGFAQNLREHETDTTARSGMRRCLGLAIELELRQEHAETAEALLRELDFPDPNLEKRIDDVRRRAADDARERQRLASLDRELDPTQHSWRRGAWLIACAAISIVVGRTVSLRGELSPERVLAGAIVAMVLLNGGLFVMRHRVSWNAFNRRLIALIVLGQLMIVGNRLIAVVYRAPASQTMTVDLLMACGLAVYASFVLVRRLVLSAFPLGIGIAAALSWPAKAPAITITALSTSLIVGALIVTTTGKRDGTTDTTNRRAGP